MQAQKAIELLELRLDTAVQVVPAQKRDGVLAHIAAPRRQVTVVVAGEDVEEEVEQNMRCPVAEKMLNLIELVLLLNVGGWESERRHIAWICGRLAVERILEARVPVKISEDLQKLCAGFTFLWKL